MADFDEDIPDRSARSYGVDDTCQEDSQMMAESLQHIADKPGFEQSPSEYEAGPLHDDYQQFQQQQQQPFGNPYNTEMTSANTLQDQYDNQHQYDDQFHGQFDNDVENERLGYQEDISHGEQVVPESNTFSMDDAAANSTSAIYGDDRPIMGSYNNPFAPQDDDHYAHDDSPNVEDHAQHHRSHQQGSSDEEDETIDDEELASPATQGYGRLDEDEKRLDDVGDDGVDIEMDPVENIQFVEKDERSNGEIFQHGAEEEDMAGESLPPSGDYTPAAHPQAFDDFEDGLVSGGFNPTTLEEPIAEASHASDVESARVMEPDDPTTLEEPIAEASHAFDVESARVVEPDDPTTLEEPIVEASHASDVEASRVVVPDDDEDDEYVDERMISSVGEVVEAQRQDLPSLVVDDHEGYVPDPGTVNFEHSDDADDNKENTMPSLGDSSFSGLVDDRMASNMEEFVEEDEHRDNDIDERAEDISGDFGYVNPAFTDSYQAERVDLGEENTIESTQDEPVQEPDKPDDFDFGRQVENNDYGSGHYGDQSQFESMNHKFNSDNSQLNFSHERGGFADNISELTSPDIIPQRLPSPPEPKEGISPFDPLDGRESPYDKDGDYESDDLGQSGGISPNAYQNSGMEFPDAGSHADGDLLSGFSGDAKVASVDCASHLTSDSGAADFLTGEVEGETTFGIDGTAATTLVETSARGEEFNGGAETAGYLNSEEYEEEDEEEDDRSQIIDQSSQGHEDDRSQIIDQSSQGHGVEDYTPSHNMDFEQEPITTGNALMSMSGYEPDPVATDNALMSMSMEGSFYDDGGDIIGGTENGQDLHPDPITEVTEESASSQPSSYDPRSDSMMTSHTSDQLQGRPEDDLMQRSFGGPGDLLDQDFGRHAEQPINDQDDEAEEERLRQMEEQLRQEEELQKQEEERERQMLDEERRIQEQADIMRQREEERKREEEEELQRQEEELRRQEEELRRQEEEEERIRQEQEAIEQQRLEAEERMRQEQDYQRQEEEKLRQEEEEKLRQEEEEILRQQEEEERLRQEEEERIRQVTELKEQEEEELRRLEEEQRRLEEEAIRQQEEAVRQQQEEEKLRLEEEAIQQEEVAKRLEEELRRQEEEELREQEEELRRLQAEEEVELLKSEQETVHGSPAVVEDSIVDPVHMSQTCAAPDVSSSVDAPAIHITSEEPSAAAEAPATDTVTEAAPAEAIEAPAAAAAASSATEKKTPGTKSSAASTKTPTATKKSTTPAAARPSSAKPSTATKTPATKTATNGRPASAPAKKPEAKTTTNGTASTRKPFDNRPITATERKAAVKTTSATRPTSTTTKPNTPLPSYAQPIQPRKPREAKVLSPEEKKKATARPPSASARTPRPATSTTTPRTSSSTTRATTKSATNGATSPTKTTPTPRPKSSPTKALSNGSTTDTKPFTARPAPKFTAPRITPTTAKTPTTPGSAGAKTTPRTSATTPRTPSSTPKTTEVKSKIGSLDKASHTPGGGNVKIGSRKIDFSNVQSRVGSKDKIEHKPGGGQVKIESRKVKVEAKSKIGSLDNATHRPAGGDKKVGETS